MMDEMVRQLGVRLRVGIHTGEVEIVGGQARGVAVHTAARVASLAKAGEVLISATTHDLLEGSGLVFDDHGLHELKGLRGQRALFALRR
jgi:class 3 adenylate cyclase